MGLKFSWVLFSNVIKGIYQWIFLIALIKFYSTTEVGLYTLGLSLLSPVFMLTDMQLKNVFIVDTEKINNLFSHYLGIRLITICLTLLLFSIYIFLFENETLLLFFLIALLKSVESIVDICHSYFQKHDDMIIMSKAIIIRSLFALIVLLASMVIGFTVELTIIMVIVTSLLTFITFDTPRLNKLKIDFQLSNISILKIRNILGHSIPLGLSVFLISYTTNFPRIQVGKHLGSSDLAVFGAYVFTVVGMTQLFVPIQIMIRPKLAFFFSEQKWNLFIKYIINSCGIIIGIGLMTLLYFYIFGEWTLNLIYNDQYIDELLVLLTLIVAQIFLSVTGIFNIGLQSMQVFNKQVFISLIPLTIVFFLTSKFIDKFELLGASLVILVYSIINFSIYTYVFFKKYRSFEK